MVSLPLIFLVFDTPVAYLSPTSRCLTVGDSLLSRAATDLVIRCWHGVSRAEFSLTEPIPLQAVYAESSRIQDYCMARLGHENMACDPKSSSALSVDFF